MWKMGFGLEKIGLAAQKRPVAFTVILLALTFLSLFHIRSINFDGSILSVLPDQSKAFQDYSKLKTNYRNFSRDVTILIESDRLDTVSGLEDLRTLQLEVSLAEGVSKAVSIFSTPSFDPITGELKDWFPEDFTTDEEMNGLIRSLIVKYPQAASLFNVERKVAVIIASLDVSVQEDDGASFAAYKGLREVAEEAAPKDFKLSFTGLTPVGASILSSLISDQSRLTVVGLLLGITIAFAIFRSFMAAILCAIPPALTALWSFGLFAFFEVPINYLTTVLPTLALILAFADGIFLYFRWQTLSAEKIDLDANLTEAIIKVGPASSLTSLTTAIAFLSFAYADSSALKEFAYLGAGVVGLAFIAVIVGLPIATHWAIRLNLIKPGTRKKPMFQGVGKIVRKIALKRPLRISLLGLVLVIVFGVVQERVVAEYKLLQYLPTDSDILYGEKLANEVIGGRSLVLLSIPFVEKGGFASDGNIERLKQVEAVVTGIYGKTGVFSANNILDTLETGQARKRLTDLADEASDEEKSDFLAKGGKGTLISVRLGSDLSIVDLQKQLGEIKAGLDQLPFGNDVIVSGFPVLMAIEFTRLIDQLRTSLLLAIALGIVFIGIATRSPMITLAAVTPNLLPIFFVLVLLYLIGGTINLSEVVALTVAFGIAVDNAVHLVNVYDEEKRRGKITIHALSSAIEEVAPALTAGTVIICVSSLVTQISNLPVVPTLGQLMIATLIVALVANLFVLPANILTFETLMDKLRFNRRK